MNNTEFENYIRSSVQKESTPTPASFSQLLSSLSDPVTKETKIRYTRVTATSHITNNIFTKIVDIWNSNRLVFIPSFIVLLFVGAFSLSPQTTTRIENHDIVALAEQDATIEGLGNDTDEQIIVASFDEPDISDFSTQTNEF